MLAKNVDKFRSLIKLIIICKCNNFNVLHFVILHKTFPIIFPLNMCVRNYY